MEILLLMLGLLGLWIGTEVTVHGAMRITNYFGWSQLFVGMTILAFGTDLPELVVAIRGSINSVMGMDSSGFIAGNAIGSCVAQIGIVAGIIAIFSTIRLGNYEIPHLVMHLGGSLLIMFLAILGGYLGRVEGIVMLLFFVLYLFLLFGQQEKAPPVRRGVNIWIQLMIVAAGLGLVTFSADLVLNKAMILSNRLGLTQTFIGAIMIGLGTSLPELGISLNAALKKNSGLSLGNLVGSNIFDSLVPMGVAACISPLAIPSTVIWFDVPFLAVVTAVFLIFLSTRSKLGRLEGVVLAVLYLTYVAVSFFVGK